MAGRVLLESFSARGHPNVRACHKTTLEFTRETSLTTRGDCIAGVASTLAPAGFKTGSKAALRAGHNFVLQIRVGNVVEEISGKGHLNLALDDDREMVFRKSTFVSGRTVLVSCNKASADLSELFRSQLLQEDVVIEGSLFLVT